MGWFFKKRVNMGNVSLNLSKSGVGVSLGVKGARLSIGPKGLIQTLGGNGIYYRKKIGAHKKSSIKELDTQELNQKGIEFGKANKLDKAVGCFVAVLKVEPENIDALSNLGNAFFLIQDYDSAEKMYKKAIKIDPEYFNALMGLGNVYDAVGDLKSAIKYFDAAADISPEDTNVLFNGARVLLKYNTPKKTKDAIKILEQILELNPDDEEAANLLETAIETVD